MPACGIYLVIEAGPDAESRLTAALVAVEAAAVLIRPPADGPLSASNTRALVAAAQAKGAAALLLDDASLARALRADGVHLAACEDIEARFDLAREIMGRRAIVGIDAGGSRHDAMTLAEVGADYVAFGRAAPVVVEGGEAGQVETPIDPISWWAEIFEVPCVAFDAATAGDARDLAARGADFVAVPVPAEDSIDDLRPWLVAIAAADMTSADQPARRG